MEDVLAALQSSLALPQMISYGHPTLGNMLGPWAMYTAVFSSTSQYANLRDYWLARLR